MTAPPPPIDVTERQPWTARMLDATVFSKVGRGRQQGYEITEVDSFKKRVVRRVAQLEGQLGVAETTAKKANEALVARSDADARATHPWERATVPEGAVDAMVQGQQLAERHDRAANAEIARRLANADRMQREAQELLDQAKDAAAAGPPVLELPPEPNPTGDVPADLEAQAQHLQACRAAYDAYREEHARWEADRRAELDRQSDALDEHQAELATQEQALGERQAGFVAELDRIAEAVPAVRSAVVDLTEAPGDEPTQAMEVAS